MRIFKRILLLALFAVIAIVANAQRNTFVSHTVEKGQTLYSISKMYNTTVDDIIKFNPGCSTKLSIGQRLIIPQSPPGIEDNVKRHTIKSGETPYRLSKMYDISTDELFAANPGLSASNFRAGEVIVIPTKNGATNEKPQVTIKATPQKKNEVQPQTIIGTHKVKRRETIESICEKYGISPKELIMANPTLKEKKLKRKMVLNIPAPQDNGKFITFEDEKPEQEVKEVKEETLTPGFKDDNVLHVAVVLSFLLDTYAPKEQSRMVEYYQGFLMAVEQLKREGYSFVINTYDAGHREESLDSLLSSGALNNAELIIGASYPKHNKQLANFAKAHQLPIVIPFSSKKDEAIDNPTAYIANGIQSFILPQVSTKFVETFPNANVLFVEDTIESNKKEFIRSLKAELVKHNMPHTTIPMELISNSDTTIHTLSSNLIEGKEFVIIPTSSSASTLNTLLPPLLSAKRMDTTNVAHFKIFGYPEWQIHAKDTRELMFELDTYFYATFYSHFSLPQVVEFQDNFRRWYNCDIQNIFPRYGMLGYDTGYFFLLAASLHGQSLHEKINETPLNAVQSDFKFERISPKDGFVNKKFFFIHLCPEYFIEKIDFDKQQLQQQSDASFEELLNGTPATQQTPANSQNSMQ